MQNNAVNKRSINHNIENLLTEKDTAKKLGLYRNTLAIWRCRMKKNKNKQKSPHLPFVKLGRAIRYRPSDVEKFIRDNTSHAENK